MHYAAINRLRSGSLRSLSLVMAVALPHLLELLLLRIVQHRFDFAVAVLHDFVRLGAAILLRHACIGSQRLHLLRAILENRLDLVHLVVGKIELLLQMGRHAIGVGRMMHARMVRLGCGCIALRLSLLRRLRQHYACRQQRAQQHGYSSFMHIRVFSLGASAFHWPACRV
jgi:hypothetical protein